MPLGLGGVERGEALEFEQCGACWQLGCDLGDVNNARAEAGEELIKLAFQGITLLLQLLPLSWRQLDVTQACGDGAELREQWLLSTGKGGELGLTLFNFLEQSLTVEAREEG